MCSKCWQGCIFQTLLSHTSAANAGRAVNSRSFLGTCAANASRAAYSRHSCHTHLQQNAGRAINSRSFLGTCAANAGRAAYYRHTCHTHLQQMLAGLSIPKAFWAQVLQMLAGQHIPDIPITHICSKCWQGFQFQKLSGHMRCKC